MGAEFYCAGLREHDQRLQRLLRPAIRRAKLQRVCFWWDKSHLDLEMIGSFASDDSLSVHVKLTPIHFIHFIHFPCAFPMSPYVTICHPCCTSLHCVALHPPGKMWMAPWSYFQHLVLLLLQIGPCTTANCGP